MRSKRINQSNTRFVRIEFSDRLRNAERWATIDGARPPFGKEMNVLIQETQWR